MFPLAVGCVLALPGWYAPNLYFWLGYALYIGKGRHLDPTGSQTNSKHSSGNPWPRTEAVTLGEVGLERTSGQGGNNVG